MPRHVSESITLTFSVITSQVSEVLIPSGLCVWKHTGAYGMRKLMGYTQRNHLIHVFVKPTNTVMLPLTEISGACSWWVSHFCHIRPQYFSLSSNCIKMINTLHLLVTFTQDKCYVIVANGKIVCFLFQNNGAVIHTKQRILILFFWRLTSCAINGRAKFKPIIMHLGWGRCPRFCPYNWQINQSCYLNPYRI